MLPHTHIHTHIQLQGQNIKKQAKTIHTHIDDKLGQIVCFYNMIIDDRLCYSGTTSNDKN